MLHDGSHTFHKSRGGAVDEFLSGKHRQRRRNVSVADLGSRQSLYLFVLKSEERAYQCIVVYVSFVRDDSL